MKIYGIIIALMMTTLHAEAGGEGSGGYGVRSHNKLFLLDLIEADAHELPLNKAGRTKLLDTRLPAFSQKMAVDNELLNRKLVELMVADNRFADNVVSILFELNWDFTDEELPFTLDDYLPGERRFPLKDMVQLAVRKSHTVRIRQAHYLKLDPINRVALIIHEAISESYYRSLAVCPAEPTTALVRQMVASLFAPYSRSNVLRLQFLTAKVYFEDCHSQGYTGD